MFGATARQKKQQPKPNWKQLNSKCYGKSLRLLLSLTRYKSNVLQLMQNLID